MCATCSGALKKLFWSSKSPFLPLIYCFALMVVDVMLFYADFFFYFQPREQERLFFLSSTLDGPCCQQQKIGVFVFYVYIFGIRYAANVWSYVQHDL